MVMVMAMLMLVLLTMVRGIHIHDNKGPERGALLDEIGQAQAVQVLLGEPGNIIVAPGPADVRRARLDKASFGGGVVAIVGRGRVAVVVVVVVVVGILGPG